MEFCIVIISKKLKEFCYFQHHKTLHFNLKKTVTFVAKYLGNILKGVGMLIFSDKNRKVKSTLVNNYYLLSLKK